MPGRFSVEAVFKAVDRFSRPIAKMQSKTRRFVTNFSRGLNRISGALQGVLGGLKKIGVAAGVAGTAVALAAKNVVGVGMEFEQAITNVGAVSLKSRGQIAALEEKAKELGATTKFTAAEVAAGMEIMAKAGFKESEILVGIEANLSAAAASGLELAEVSSHVSNVLKGMNLEATDAARVADVLALASSKTNSTIGTLGESMKNVAATASQLNIPLEDVVASVALLQDKGLDASVAGSAMNTMLTKLAAVTPGMRKEMKKMGVAFEDTEGNMLALPKILENFAKASKESGGNARQLAFFAELVGLRGQKAALLLNKLGESGDLGELTEQLKKAGGKAKEMAELRMDTLTGDITLLKSAVDGVKVALFEAQGSPLRGMIQGMTEWISNSETQRKILFEVQLWIWAFQGALEGANKELSPLVGWLKKLGKFLINSKENVAIWTVRAAQLAAAIWVLNVAIKAVNIVIAAYALIADAAAVAQSAFTLATNIGKAAIASHTVAVIANTVRVVAATAVRKLHTAALVLGRIATTGFTVATILNTAAAAANAIVIRIVVVALRAYEVVSAAITSLLKLRTLWTKRATTAEIVAAAKTKILTAVRWLHTVAVNAASTAWKLYTAATVGATLASKGALAAMMPFLGLMLGLAAAIGSILLLLDQLQKLEDETGGLGLTGLLAEMWKSGTFNPATASDNVANRRARAAAEKRQQSGGEPTISGVQPISAPGGGGTGERDDQHATLLIRDETGRGELIEKPKGPLDIDMERTGVFT